MPRWLQRAFDHRLVRLRSTARGSEVECRRGVDQDARGAERLAQRACHSRQGVRGLVGELELLAEARHGRRRVTVTVEPAVHPVADARAQRHRDERHGEPTAQRARRRAGERGHHGENREEDDQAGRGHAGDDERAAQHDVDLDDPVAQHGNRRGGREQGDRCRQRRGVDGAFRVERQDQDEVGGQRTGRPQRQPHSRSGAGTGLALHGEHPGDNAHRDHDAEAFEQRHPGPGLRDAERVLYVVDIAERARVEHSGEAHRCGRDEQQRSDRPPPARRQRAVGKEQHGPRDQDDQADEDPVVQPCRPLHQRPVASRRHVRPGCDEQPDGRDGSADQQREPEPVPRAARDDERPERRARGNGQAEPDQRQELVGLRIRSAIEGDDDARADQRDRRHGGVDGAGRRAAQPPERPRGGQLAAGGRGLDRGDHAADHPRSWPHAPVRAVRGADGGCPSPPSKQRFHGRLGTHPCRRRSRRSRTDRRT